MKHNKPPNNVRKTCPTELSDRGHSVCRVWRKKGYGNEMVDMWQSSNCVNFIYKICLSDRSRPIKAYKHMINLGSVVLNFSGSHLLPSSLMRRELHTGFGIQQACTPKRRSVTENTLVEISCIRHPESIPVTLMTDPNCQSSPAVNRQFLRDQVGRTDRNWVKRSPLQCLLCVNGN